MRTHTRLSRVMAEYAAKAVPKQAEPPPPDPAVAARLARMSRQQRREAILAAAPPPPAWRMQHRCYEDAFGSVRIAPPLADQFDPKDGPPPGLIDWSRRR